MNIPIKTFEQFLYSKNLKDTTIQQYIYHLNKFVYDKFNQETVSIYLSQKGNRNSQGRSFIKNLKLFLKTYHKELNLSLNDYEEALEVEIPRITGRTERKIVRPLSEEQVRSLEPFLETERLKIMLLLTYYCGLRVNELYRIQIISFNWPEWKKNPEGRGECIVYGKGGKEGIALVPSELMKRIAKFIKDQEFINIQSRIFLRKIDQKIKLRNACRFWQNKLREAGIKSGLTSLDENGKIIPETKVHPHRLRHSFAVYLLKGKNLNLREVQELLRHASIQSTQIYTYIDKDELKEKLDKIDSLKVKDYKESEIPKDPLKEDSDRRLPDHQTRS